MPTVNDVLRLKDRRVIYVEISDSVLLAVKTMNENRVGAVVILDIGELAGIFTERDVLTKIVAAELSPEDTPVSAVMTTPVICCNLATDIDDVAQIMLKRHIRHLPVRGAEDHIVGMISIHDINAFNVGQKQATIENMADYILGRG